LAFFSKSVGWLAGYPVRWPRDKKGFKELTGKPDNRQTFAIETTVGDDLRLKCKLL
jgi:hypothetical protein